MLYKDFMMIICEFQFILFLKILITGNSTPSEKSKQNSAYYTLFFILDNTNMFFSESFPWYTIYPVFDNIKSIFKLNFCLNNYYNSDTVV